MLQSFPICILDKKHEISVKNNTTRAHKKKMNMIAYIFFGHQSSVFNEYLKLLDIYLYLDYQN